MVASPKSRSRSCSCGVREAYIFLGGLHAERADLYEESAPVEVESVASQLSKIVAERAAEARRLAAIRCCQAACASARSIEADDMRERALASAMVELARHHLSGGEMPEAIGLLLCAVGTAERRLSATAASRATSGDDDEGEGFSASAILRHALFSLVDALNRAHHWEDNAQLCMAETQPDGRVSSIRRSMRPCRSAQTFLAKFRRRVEVDVCRRLGRARAGGGGPLEHRRRLR